MGSAPKVRARTLQDGKKKLMSLRNYLTVDDGYCADTVFDQFRRDEDDLIFVNRGQM